MGKPFWQSKTIWVNMVAVAAALAGTFGIQLDAVFQGQIVALVMGVVNIVLRFVTKEAVTSGA